MSGIYLGQILQGGWNFAPRGTAFCNGQLISIAQNSALFALLGTQFGGNGQTTFALPNLQGRSMVHWGTGPGLSTYVIGQKAGTETVTVLPTQMPAHTHTMVATSGASTAVTPGTALLPGTVSGDTLYVNTITGNNPLAMLPQAVTQAGGSQPHENRMPTLTVQYCIATQGIFPSQS